MKQAQARRVLLKKLAAQSTRYQFLNLVLAFEGGCRFINSNDSDAFAKLTEMLQAGGDPVGFISLAKEAQTASRLSAKPLKEYAADPEINQLLFQLLEIFAAKLTAHGAKGACWNKPEFNWPENSLRQNCSAIFLATSYVGNNPLIGRCRTNT